MRKYKIADVIFSAECKFKYTEKILSDYGYDGSDASEFSVQIGEEDILAERKIAQSYSELPEFSDEYLESVLIFKRLSDYIFKYKNGMLFHCSAVSVGGKAVLFTGRSGAGKSTHARLWREYLGDKAVMINDDKPIIRFVNGAFVVYGTPWTGKHHIGGNEKAEVVAVCEIVQAKENKIKRIVGADALSVLLNQTVRPETPSEMEKLLDFMENFLSLVKVYRLDCDVSLDAAALSYEKIFGGKGNEN